MMYSIEKNLTNVNYTYRGTNPTWIVIHNTANGSSVAGTAWANTNYFKNVVRNASAHYFVDDGDIVWQCVDDTNSAWHVGDKYPSYNGASNYNAIGIEVCERSDGSFSEHEIDVLCWLVPMLMEKYGIDANHVCRHYDVTGKLCPMGYIIEDAWNWLKAIITGGEDMRPADVWEYNWNNTAPRGNMYNTLTGLYEMVDSLSKKVDSLSTKVDKISVGGVDVKAVAKAVNDDVAQRMKG